mmetsp:Transcript_126697/g.405665  ORF Transcript_126697/g.405665 Transcript_126697/m.405665 type:complete len:306 (+) Transcript_126697:834-1751(+)
MLRRRRLRRLRRERPFLLQRLRRDLPRRSSRAGPTQPIALDGSHSRYSVRGVHLHHASTEPLRIARKPWKPEIQHTSQKLLVLESPLLVQEGVRATVNYLVHGHTSSPQVSRIAVPATPLRHQVHFRGHEAGRSALLSQQLTFRKKDRHAEVRELQHAGLGAARRHHEVVRFDVAVADLLPVKRADREADVPHPLRGLRLSHARAPLPQLVAEVAAVAVLLREVHIVSILEGVKQLDDVLVGACLHHRNLALNILLSHAVAPRQRLIHVLHRDRRACAPVDGPPHGAEGAMAQANLLQEVNLLQP